MRLTQFELKKLFEMSPETKQIIDETMPQGCDAYLIFREKENGSQQSVISFRTQD